MSARRMRIEGEMTIYRAAELKQALLGLLAGERPARVDLSAVTEIDTAGVQLLWLAREAARASGRDLRFVAPSAAVREATALLGLQPALGLEDAA